MTDIKNFIPVYPDRTDPLLGKKLANLKEFYDKRLLPEEEDHTEPGIPYNHQESQGRYFSPKTLNISGIIDHGLGTGKTCVASIIVENFKKTFISGEPRKPALIILKNDHLIDSFRASIAKECTKQIYNIKLDVNLLIKHDNVEENNERKVRSELKALISKSYEIVTIGKLFGTKSKSDEYNKREYSNRVIIIDESHHYREQPGKSTVSDSKKSKDTKKKDGEISDKKILKHAYSSLHHFLHLLTNSRVYLLTGTPIWDKVYDISSQLNLILPMDEQLPILNNFIKEFFDKDGVLKPENIDRLKNAMRGRISYVRSKRTDKRIDVGTVEPWLKFTKVYPSIMSKFQYDYSNLAKNHIKPTMFDHFNAVNNPDKKSSKKEGQALKTATDAATCVYPEIKNGKLTGKGVYGTDIFLEYAANEKRMPVTKTTTDPKTGESITKEKIQTIYKYEFKHELLKTELGPNYNDPNGDILSNLRKYSTKFATIIEMLLDPKRLKEKAFIFIESVNGTGGALSLALILKLYGFVWRKTPGSIGQKKYVSTVKSPGNFVVITSKVGTIKDATQIEKVIQKCNHNDNVYGEQLRIIIGSETISHGITLKAMRQAHAVSGYWNFPSIDQPMGRVYRLGSFNQLPEDERFVSFYWHVAVKEGSKLDDEDPIILSPEVGNLRGKSVSTEKTMDIHVYELAENKEEYNSQIHRLSKIMSWDCALTYERNVLQDDIDGTRECNLTECDYVCDGYDKKSITVKKKGPLKYSYVVNPNNIDHSNYNLLYSTQQSNEYITDIINLFKRYFVLNFDKIMELLAIEEVDKFVLLKALDKIIVDRIHITNQYGAITFLKEDRNIYFLDDSTSPIPSYPMVIYGIFPFVSELTSLEDAIEIVQLKNDEKLVADFIHNPSIDLFHRISQKSRIIMLEAVISMEHLNKDKCKNSQQIIDIVNSALKKEIYKMNDGMIVHNMYNLKETGVKYNILTKDLKANGRMRVFDPSNAELGWSYVTSIEETNYIAEIKKNVAVATKSGFENNPYGIYGTSDKSNDFKIVMEGKKGVKCSFIPVPSILEIYFNLNHLPYANEIKIKTDTIPKNKPLLIELLKTGTKGYVNIPDEKKVEWNITAKDLEKKSVEELLALYTLFVMSRKELCTSLERWFRGENADKKSYFV